MSDLSTNRYFILFEGIILIFLGILAVFLPVASTLTAELFIGWLLFIAGLIQGYRAFQVRHHAGFYPSLFNAILNIAVGLLLVIYPVAGMLSLTILLSFFFILDGISKIFFGFRLKNYTNWMWLVISGILSLAMAAIIYAGWPESAFWVIGLLIGINLIFFGCSLIALSLGFQKLIK